MSDPMGTLYGAAAALVGCTCGGKPAVEIDHSYAHLVPAETRIVVHLRHEFACTAAWGPASPVSTPTET